MSGEAWIGDLPDNWVLKRLGALGAFSKGAGGSKEDNRDTGHAVVRYGELYGKFDRFIREPLSFISPEDSFRYTPLPPGSLVFAASGEDPGEIGRSALSLLPAPAFVGGDSVIFTPDLEVVDPVYLTFVLDSKPLTASKAVRATGFTVVHISAGKLKTLPIPVPPLDEQRAIADYLNREVAEIDALVTKQGELVELLRERRSAVSTAALAGLPNVKLRRLVDPGRPMTYGILQAGEHHPGGVPYLGPSDLPGEGKFPIAESLRRTSSDIATKYSRSVLRGGDIVVSIGPAYGRVAVVPDELAGGNLTQDTVRVALKNELVETRYIILALGSHGVKEYWNSQIQGATFRRLNLGTLAATPIPMSDLREQRSIARDVDKQTFRIDTLIAKAEEHIALAKERRSALITAAVTGQIDVRTARKVG